MTNRRWLTLALAGIAVVLIVTVALHGEWAHREPRETLVRSDLGSKSAPVVEAWMADSLAVALVRKAPFRWSRHAVTTLGSSVIGLAGPGAGAPPAPPKPNLLLAGIVWGRHPLAVLEGVPGAAEPRVVSEGDSVGGLHVRLVARDRVVVSGFDTLWTLQLKVGWP